MEQLLEKLTSYLVALIQLNAVVVIAIGVLEALWAMPSMLLQRHPSHDDEREIWLDFTRWMVAGLTLQLGADIVQTTVAPTWSGFGRLASIATTRAFLGYVLDRERDAVRQRQLRSTRV